METPTCVSCRYFRPLRTGGRGYCLHPHHQYPGAPISVRSGELNCYRGFGRHDWAPAIVGQQETPQDIVLSERPAPFRTTRLTIALPLDQPLASTVTD